MSERAMRDRLRTPARSIPRGSITGPASPARRLRGCVTGVVAALGAHVAHGLSGGAPTAGVTLIVLLLAVCGGLALSHLMAAVGRTPGLPSLLSLTAAAQVLSHSLYGATPGTGTPMPGHTMPPMHASGVGHQLGHAAGSGMLLGHVLVAVLAAVIARLADGAVVGTVRGVLARWFGRPPARPRPLPTLRRPTAPPGALLRPPVIRSRQPVCRRGPPLHSAPALAGV